MSETPAYDVPDAVPSDPDDDKDLTEERLDDDFDIAGARDESRQQLVEKGPSEAEEVVDGS